MRENFLVCLIICLMGFPSWAMFKKAYSRKDKGMSDFCINPVDGTLLKLSQIKSLDYEQQVIKFYDCQKRKFKSLGKLIVTMPQENYFQKLTMADNGVHLRHLMVKK